MPVESVIFDTVPRSHPYTWGDPRYATIYPAMYLKAHRLALAAGGIVIRGHGGPPAASHPCTICGKRTCPSVTKGIAGCVDTDTVARARGCRNYVKG